MLIQRKVDAHSTAIATHLIHARSIPFPHTRQIQEVADSYGFDSVKQFCGHGVGRQFHMAPFVQHYRNRDKLTLEEGMVFTIEPMLCEGSADCFVLESDGWTVTF
jgi:methionine aminopeptidase